MKRLLIAATTLLLSGACSEDPVTARHIPCDDRLLEYSAVVGDTLEAEGIRYIEREVGSGQVADIDSVVELNYAGYLLDGTRFDWSCPIHQSVMHIKLGAFEVIPGFDLGVRGMQPGGLRRIIIPPELAYGSDPVGALPGNSTLVFDIQLIGFVRR